MVCLVFLMLKVECQQLVFQGRKVIVMLEKKIERRGGLFFLLSNLQIEPFIMGASSLVGP